MKLNKLLTPILGLATVSTIVVPLATSCTTESTTTDHIKISNKSEEVTPNSSGVANYLFVLDSNEYDEHGFKVSTTVNEKDTSGVVDSDFTTTWEIDGDHLLVHIAYEGEEEAPEDDVAIKLNIHINYGSEWNKTFDVKYNYEAVKDIEMLWYSSNVLFRQEYKSELTTGMSPSYVANFSLMSDDDFKNYGARIDIINFSASSEDGIVGCYFKGVKIYLNDELVSTDKYKLYSSEISGYYSRVAFTDSTFLKSRKKTDVIKFSFESLGIFTSEKNPTQLEKAYGGAIFRASRWSNFPR